MSTSAYINYLLLFAVVLGTLLYVYAAFSNKKRVSVNFFGSEKKLSLTSLILICFADGAILGVILGYLIFRFI